MSIIKYRELINNGAQRTRHGSIMEGSKEFPNYLCLLRKDGSALFKSAGKEFYELHLIQIDHQAIHETDEGFRQFKELNLTGILEKIDSEVKPIDNLHLKKQKSKKSA